MNLLSRLIGILIIGLAAVVTTTCTRESNTVTALAVHPAKSEIVYAVTNDGLHKTRDAGKSWTPINEGLGAARVISIAVHPVYHSTVFTGTLGDSVYRSMTGGQKWSIINAGMKAHIAVVNGFVFDPRDKNTLYAATTVGIFRTRNNGLLWEEVPNTGLNSIYVVSLILDHDNPDILYAGTSGAVYRSDDAGQTWKTAYTGMIEDSTETALALGVNALVQDPATPDVLYAATTRGIFKSTDRTASWFLLRIGDQKGELFVSALALDPNQPETLYAGTTQGIFGTDDGGETWNPVNQGLANTHVRALVMDANDPRILYAGTHGGIFKSTDGGESWTHLPLR
jgi:photosystem II stability/assembly factor-like uncharacterized protein